MKRLLIVLIAAFALGGAGAYAADGGRSSSHDSYYHSHVNEQYSWIFRLLWRWISHIHDSSCGHGTSGGTETGGSGSVAQVPELEASGAALALLLLAGLLALRRETKAGS